MGDELAIEEKKRVSSVELNQGPEKGYKEMAWSIEFSFEMGVPKDPKRRPYVYFNNDCTLMLLQYQGDFSADILEMSSRKFK